MQKQSQLLHFRHIQFLFSCNRNLVPINPIEISHMGCFKSTLSRQLTKSNFIYLELKIFLYTATLPMGEIVKFSYSES